MEESKVINSNFLQPRDAWDRLSLAEKAEMMKVAVNNGIFNLQDIRDKYNELAEGGGLEDSIIEEANEFKGGGYKPSSSVKKRISTWEGRAMTGAKDPLSSKWGKNRSFEAEADSFYDALPAGIREQVLNNPELADNLFSYSYNVGAGNFKKRVVPALEKYYSGNGSAKEVANSMWASGDKKLRGLRNRRAVEKKGVMNALSPAFMPQSVDNTFVYNPYILPQQNTTMLPQMVPDEDAYVSTHEVSPEEQRAAKLKESFDNINKFNTIMKMIGIENTAIPEFIPTSGNPFIDSLWANEYASGGKIHIKPENRGKFTALKKRTGKSASWFKAHGTPAQKKMATFALNARKWKHGLGGNLYDGTSQPTQKIQKASDYRYVQAGKDNSWSMVDNDEMARVFQGFTATPNDSKQKFIPEIIDNSLEAASRRDRFLQNRNESGTLIGEPGLEAVHPEFDIIALGPLAGMASKYAANKIGTAVSTYAAEHPGIYQYPRYALGKIKYGFDAELPTLYRKVKGLPTVENGRIQISNPDNRFAFDNGYGEESPLITNFTTDAPVRSHGAGDWDRGLTLSFPGKSLLGKKVISTRPSDTFTFGENITVPVKNIKGFTGRQKEIKFLNDNGIEAISSPDAQIYFDSGVKDYITKAAKSRADRQKILQMKAERKGPALLKPKEPLDDFSNYAREIENLTRETHKAPTAKDYAFMDYVFRPQYTSQTMPVIEDITLDAAMKYPLLGEWAGNVERLRYLGDFSRWGNVMYDPLTTAEANFRKALNIGLKPNYKK